MVIELITVVGTSIVVLIFFNTKLSKTVAKEIDKIKQIKNEYGNIVSTIVIRNLS
ncbi:MAG: hypothetical protein ABDH59_02470 [Fervidobacterium sp.]